ncbi:hypothetical protein [Paraburkholderia sp. SIMBA_054]|uniref:hypothetical protein n=1 Tax=Paraburkholderia sp. SIMBA_054 TaxID=3085795 RepID=UPI00397A8701
MNTTQNQAGKITEITDADVAAARAAGFTVHHGEPDCPDVDLRGRWWWVLGQPGWSGYDTGEGDFETEREAWSDAVRTLRNDPELSVKMPQTSAPDPADVAEWVGLHYRRNFDAESPEQRKEWTTRFVEAHAEAAQDPAGKMLEATLSDSEWDRFERAGYNAIQRLGFDLGIEGDDEAKVRTLLVSLQAYCVTYAVDLEAQLTRVREQIASGDLQSPRWGDWVNLPEVAPVAGKADQVRDNVGKALAVPHAAEIRSESMDASGVVVANAAVSGAAPVSAAVLDLLKALQTLIPHVLHYAAMPAAHPDAHKDAANARAVIAEATAHQQESASK